MTRPVVIVTGSREWEDEAAIDTVLRELAPSLVVQGGARGADTIARRWAEAYDVPSVTVEADWKREGRRAGVLRNCRMLRHYPFATVAAFPLEGPGTFHCMREAEALGMRLVVHKGRR